VPNLLTVPGDPLAGFLLAGGPAVTPSLVLVLCASLVFYAAGLIINDVADFETDRKERPERPLPSGHVSIRAARNAAFVMMLAALGLCVGAGGKSTAIGAALCAAILSYNCWMKRHALLGPLNMGLCRALNLALGASAVGVATTRLLVASAVLTAYVSLVTYYARKETAGGPSPKTIGLLISLLLPLQAIFCAAARAGNIGMISGLVLLALWPLNRLLSRWFYAS
jgi:4-hydroxybenzoate polyprenyltransferase